MPPAPTEPAVPDLDPSSADAGRTLAIAVGWSRSASDGDRPARIARAVERLAPGRPQTRLDDESSLLVVAGGSRGRLERLPAQGFALPLSRGAADQDGRRVSAVELATSADPAELATRMLPPFAALVRPPGSGRIMGLADRYGLRHLYYLTGPGWAAMATSALLLADAFDEGPDLVAHATYGLLGHLLDQQTPYSRVVKLEPGSAAVIADGVLTLLDGTWSEPTTGAPASCRSGASAVRHAVQACLTAAPDAGVELSGGFDSRLVLASIPREARRGRRAVTIGSQDAEDVVIARELARRTGLVHEWIDTADLARLDPREAGARVTSSARARDFAGNGVAYAALDWVEDELGPAARLTGQNGELARGFFYPLQPPLPRPTGWLVDALLKTRLTANEAADLAVFAPKTAADLRACVSDAVRAAFARYQESWLHATDRFYLDQRMHRWVGLDFTAGTDRRPILAPFFDPGFVAWALAAAPRAKRHDRLFAQVLLELDPELASLPLQGRASPTTYAHPSVRQSLADAGRTAQKVRNKVVSKARRRGRPALGATDLASLVRQSWREDSAALSHVRSLPEIDGRVVADYCSGARTASPATVALLVNLDGAMGALAGGTSGADRAAERERG